MKLIDNSYHMADFEIIRKHYQQALYHLVAVARTSINKENVLQVPRYVIYFTQEPNYFHSMYFLTLHYYLLRAVSS